MAVFSSGCQAVRNQATFDRSGEKELQDYRDLFSPRRMATEETLGKDGAPDLMPMVATPPDLILPSPLVTVAVNQTVSLRDLMFELAEQANVDIEMDPQIRGSLIFTARDKPFNEVIDRICAMAGLRYTFGAGVLRIELDRPYVKTYRVDYMGVTRTSASSINSSISVSGSSSGASSTSTTAGSNSSISGSYTSGFWTEIDAGLKQVLAASDTFMSLATQADPVATPMAAPNADPNAPPSLSTPTLNVAMGPSGPAAPNPASTFTIAKETGIVTVFASERQHKLVKKFLDTYRKITMTQILIETKVLEVSLSDEFMTGIQWGNLDFGRHLNAQLDFPNAGIDPLAGGSQFNVNLDLGHLFNPMVRMLSTYGTVRALSSPRVTVMNNQPAVVNVSRNRVYFTATSAGSTTTTNGVTTTIPPTFSPASAPEGVLLNVLPTANPDTGEIILSLRPTVSKITAMIPDPGLVGNSVPELSVQEIDSIVKMQSGQTMVMGGLMRDDNTVSTEGVPVAADIPVIGNLFRNRSDDVRKSELVILLQATIAPGSTVDINDRRIYNAFAKERRSFTP